MSKFIDLTGQKFGRLTVIEREENDKIFHIFKTAKGGENDL